MGSLSQTRLSDFTLTFHFHALEKEMATHASVLVWRIPGTGEPGGLPSMGSQRVRHDWSDLAAAAAGNAKTCMHMLYQHMAECFWSSVIQLKEFEINLHSLFLAVLSSLIIFPLFKPCKYMIESLKCKWLNIVDIFFFSLIHKAVLA